MGVMNEAVEDSVGIGWITDDIVPAVDGKLACDDGGAGAARLAVSPAGESPVSIGVQVDAVVISSEGKGDRPVQSLEVQAPCWREAGQVVEGEYCRWSRHVNQGA